MKQISFPPQWFHLLIVQSCFFLLTCRRTTKTLQKQMKLSNLSHFHKQSIILLFWSRFDRFSFNFWYLIIFPVLLITNLYILLFHSSRSLKSSFHYLNPLSRLYIACMADFPLNGILISTIFPITFTFLLGPPSLFPSTQLHHYKHNSFVISV